MKKRTLHYAWLILLGVIFIRGFAGGGINMTSGLFLPPVAGELGVGIGTISVYFSITAVVMVVWLPFAGRLLNRFDIRLMAVLGAVLQAGSFAAFGLMNSVWGWYLLAIPHAMGAVITVNLLGPILINRWFAQNTGMMIGLQVAFAGLFGAVLQPFTSRFIAANGWRDAYFLVGGLTFVVVLLSSVILLRNRPAEKSLSPYGSGDIGTVRQKLDGVQIPEGVAMHSASFLLLLLFMIAITGVGVFSQHIPTYGTLLGFGLHETGSAMAASSVGSAIGSVVIGIFCDRLGSLKTCYGVLGLGVLAVLCFLFGGESLLIFSTASFLHGILSAGIMVLTPILTIAFYGQQDYEKIFAKVSMGAPIASIVLIPAYGFIYDLTQSYLSVLLVMLLLLTVAAICITFGWRLRCTLEGCPRWSGSKQNHKKKGL